MKLTQVVGQVATFATAAYASSIDGDFVVCTDPNFGGICTLGFATNFCQNFVAPFTDAISSLKVADGKACRFFDNNNCQDDQAVLNNVRAGEDLSSLFHTRGGNLDDKFASVFCVSV